MVPDHCASSLLDWKGDVDGPVHLDCWLEGSEALSSHSSAVLIVKLD